MPLILAGATSGQATLQATDAATVTMTLPATSGTLVVTGGAQTIEFADGSAAAPSITNSGDTNTGMFFPAADTIAFTEGGTEAMRIDSSGNVGIGTASPANKLDVITSTASTSVVARVASTNSTGANSGTVIIGNGGTGDAMLRFDYEGSNTDRARIGVTTSNQALQFFTAGNNERMRIDSSGNLLVGRTNSEGARIDVFNGTSTSGVMRLRNDTGGAQIFARFDYGGSIIGSITGNNSATAYNTSSDYRLKENIAPMTGALSVVQQLKPVTYKWKVDGSDGQGFIAHELQEVVPDCVVGEKDAMRTEQYEVSPAIPATYDEEGNELIPAVEAVMGEREVPEYQGVDTSFLVATLTAAIQELKATVDAQAARIAALEGAK